MGRYFTSSACLSEGEVNYYLVSLTTMDNRLLCEWTRDFASAFSKVQPDIIKTVAVGRSS